MDGSLQETAISGSENLDVKQHALPRGGVLLVDDDDIVIRVNKRILERAGFEVVTAAGGREAIDFYMQHADKIDCVLLDYMMPQMDGYETFCALRRMRSDLPVIMISGCAQSEVMGRFQGSQPDGFIPKPLEMRSLLDRLDAILEQRRLREASP